MPKLLVFSLLILLLLINACKPAQNGEGEKAAIIKALNNETRAFFRRDYTEWKKMWVQKSFVSKTYMRMNDSSLAETVGWDVIDKFGKNYIAEHPQPEPMPALLNEIAVRLYGNGAWVSFEQQDSLRGLKRETRLMEKINGEWKIAGMHTTIYGFKK